MDANGTRPSRKPWFVHACRRHFPADHYNRYWSVRRRDTFTFVYDSAYPHCVRQHANFRIALHFCPPLHWNLPKAGATIGLASLEPAQTSTDAGHPRANCGIAVCNLWNFAWRMWFGSGTWACDPAGYNILVYLYFTKSRICFLGMVQFFRCPFTIHNSHNFRKRNHAGKFPYMMYLAIVFSPFNCPTPSIDAEVGPQFVSGTFRWKATGPCCDLAPKYFRGFDGLGMSRPTRPRSTTPFWLLILLICEMVMSDSCNGTDTHPHWELCINQNQSHHFTAEIKENSATSCYVLGFAWFIVEGDLRDPWRHRGWSSPVTEGICHWKRDAGHESISSWFQHR